MSESNVLKLDIKSLSLFQKELHYPDRDGGEQDINTIKNYNLPEEIKKILIETISNKYKVNSRFSCKIEKNAWSTHTKVKMPHTAEGNEVIYVASKKFDVLFKTEMHINLLPIKVKDKYKKRIQICYPHNPGHNICHQGELKIDDDHHQYMDDIWLDFYSQFFMKNGAGKREHYNRMIGNVACLEDWGSELPGMRLIVPQPYSYSRNTRVALRTLRSSMNTVTHHYKIRNKFHEILRMRVKSEKDGSWNEIQCKMNYLDIPENAKELPIPELWGRHALMTDEERDWHKSIDEETGEPIKHTIYTEDIVIATSNNPTTLGSTDVIPLHCKSPCKSLFWVAQDTKAIENRNFSNYSTNLENLFSGWNPCSKVDLKYGGAFRVEKLSSEHFELSEPWDFFPSAPSEPGYNGYSLGYEPTTLNADTAIVLEPLHASLHITLGDTDPFRSIDEAEEEYSDQGEIIPVEALGEDSSRNDHGSKYLIHVRALVYKKLVMSWNEKSKCLKYVISEDATKKQ